MAQCSMAQCYNGRHRPWAQSPRQAGTERSKKRKEEGHIMLNLELATGT